MKMLTTSKVAIDAIAC